MQAGHVTFDRITKQFDQLAVIAEPFSLSIARDEFIVFLGPSGCGKTTLMRMIGGLDTPSGGNIRLGGEHNVGQCFHCHHGPCGQSGSKRYTAAAH